jgi:hypothetical protein
MSNSKLLPRLLLFSGMIALLLMAFLFDLAVMGLQIRNSEGAGLEPLLVWLFPLFELLLALGGLGLFWYLFSSAQKDRPIGSAFTIFGLLLLFLTPLLFFLPVPMTLYAIVQYVSPGSYLFQAGALLGVTGLLSLALKR